MQWDFAISEEAVGWVSLRLCLLHPKISVMKKMQSVPREHFGEQFTGQIDGGEAIYGAQQHSPSSPELTSARRVPAAGSRHERHAPCKHSTQRRSEADVLKQDISPPPPAPVKRVARFKRPTGYDDDEPKSALSDTHRKLSGILHKLQRHPLAGPFLRPVDVSLVPDYHDIVHEPIDLSTIAAKLDSGQYTSAYEFSVDVRKVWSNAFLYNAQGTDLYQATVALSAYFESLFKGCEQLLLTDRGDALENLYKQVEALKKEIRDIKGPKVQRVSGSQADRPMTLQEKKALGQSIRALQPQHLRGLLNIIKDSLPANIQGTELEFDIDTLSPKVCRDLEKYVKQCFSPVANPPRPHTKKKPSAPAGPKPASVNEKLEDLAASALLPAHLEGSDNSESSSSSSGDELDAAQGALGLDIDVFGGGEYTGIWPGYQQPRGGADHTEAYMLDFNGGSV